MGCTEASVLGDVTNVPSHKNKTANFFYSSYDGFEKGYPQNSANSGQEHKIRHNLSEAYMMQKYEQSGGDLKIFFSLLSQRVTQFYNDLSNEVLDLLNNHKIDHNSTKVFISQQVLLMALDVLEVVGKKINYQYQKNTFHHFNRAQINLIGYLKMKYPRAGNVFISGQLADKFKSFDYVDHPKHDILSKSKINFTDTSDLSIIKNIKMFFNRIIEQLDAKFPIFQKMMQQQVFKCNNTTQQQNKHHKTLNFKIGRKIPQSAAKFIIDDSEQLTMESPEIFRTIIKWVEQMQQWFNGYQDLIYRKSSFKTFAKSKTGQFYDIITKDEVDQLTEKLRQKLKEQGNLYQDKLQSLRGQMDVFNINLLKILYTTQRKQKYVPLHEAKIIKFAMFNTKLIQWLLSEMLIFMIKALVKVGQQMQKTKVRKRMDFVSFGVQDLMRAQLVGNKRQILTVYKNVEQLQRLKKINIIKIKNRLGTSLNDVMIIFTISESYLICELQLILSEGSSEVQRLKNIQFLNHVLYELQRSPYGVLSQVAAILGYKDNKINFQNKISFEKNKSVQFKYCQASQHRVNKQKIQKKPFLCIQCTQYYHPLQNIFQYKHCETCHTFQCCRCAFAEDPHLQEKQINQRFLKQLQYQIFTTKIKPKIPKTLTIDKLIKVFYPQKLYFRNIFKKKKQIYILPKDVKQFIKSKSFLKQTNNPDLENMAHLYFLLVQFRGNTTNLKLLYWNESQNQIQNCFNPNQIFSNIPKIPTSHYDFLIFLKTQSVTTQKPEKLSTHIRLCLKPEQLVPNIKSYRYLNVDTKNKVIFVLKIQITKMTNNIGGIQINQQKFAHKKQFGYDSLADIRKKLPALDSVKQEFYLKNMGVTTDHLSYFIKCDEKQIIRYINFSDNKIADASIIFSHCKNLEQINISKNFIKKLEFKSQLKNLKKIIAYDNFISYMDGFNFILNLRKLNLEHNKLKKIEGNQMKNMKNLTEMNISKNKFQSLNWLQSCKDSDLQILIMSNAGINLGRTEIGNYNFTLPFTQLKQLNYSNNQTEQLTVVSQYLNYLDCSNCSLKKLKICCAKIEYLNLANNDINNLQQILKQRMPQLKQLDCTNAGPNQTQLTLPQINASQLLQLNLSNCNFKDFSNLQKSNLIRLQSLILDGNKNINSLPVLKIQTLKKLSLKDVKLTDLKFVTQSSLPLLEQLQIVGQGIMDKQKYLQDCECFKFPKVSKLKFTALSFRTIKSFAISQLPELQQLNFECVNIQIMPTLKFDKLKSLHFKLCQIQNVQQFQKSIFPNLQNLNIYRFNQFSQGQNKSQDSDFNQCQKLQNIQCPKLKKLQIIKSPSVNIQNLFNEKFQLEYFNAENNKMKKLPIINLLNAKVLDFSDCQIQDIDNLSQCSLQNIQKLIFDRNYIKNIPKINMPKLKILTFVENEIKDIRKFQKSYLPELTNLNLCKNNLKFFPSLRFSNLKQLKIGENPIQNLQGLSNCYLQNLSKLYIKDCYHLKTKNFPVINFPSCKKMKIIRCNIENLDNLQKSNLPFLDSLEITLTPLKKLPILKLQSLRIFKCQMFNYLYTMSISKLQNQNEKYQGKQNKQKVVKLQQMQQQQQQLEMIKKICMLNESQQKDKNKLNSLFATLKKAEYRLSDISNLSFWVCPKIQTIQIQNSSARKLPKLTFNSLQNLILIKGELDDINQLDNSTLSSLVQINFSQNKWLHNLKFPNSADNIIYNDCNFPILQSKQLAQTVFKSLELKNSNLKQIKKMNIQQLQFINLQNNMLTDLTNVFKQFPLKLRHLNLKKNQIKSIPQFSFPQLNYLKVSYNLLQTITIKRKNYPSLCYLYLQNNKISKVQCFDITTLTSINLSNNCLQQVNFFDRNLPQTQQMRISNLKLQNNSIAAIKYLPKVGLLSLNRNKLSNLNWLQCCQTQSLSRLWLSQNLLTDIKQILKNTSDRMRFKLLSELDLSKNCIQQFKLQNVRFPILNYVNLSNNRIRQFPTFTQFQLPALLKLNLSFNVIEKLPIYSRSNKLKVLYLNDNLLSDFKNCQFVCKQLNQLQISNNRLNDISDISNIKSYKLQKINLSGNIITKLPQFTKNFASIKKLQVDRNPLKDVSQFIKSQFGDWTNLELIYEIDIRLTQIQIKQIVQALVKSTKNSKCKNRQIDLANMSVLSKKQQEKLSQMIKNKIKSRQIQIMDISSIAVNDF